MTEREAKQKWCPFFQVSAGSAYTMSKDNRPSGSGRCLGTGCMAWRRGPDDKANEGYCGLAGKP